MLTAYFPLIIVAVLALGLGAIVVLLAHLLGPRRPVPARRAISESGMPPWGDARLQIPVKFYAAAMVFVILDVALAFLYPWAVAFRELLQTGSAAFFAMLTFCGVLLVGLVYVWRHGLLEWE